jgi:hypothetical protein
MHLKSLPEVPSTELVVARNMAPRMVVPQKPLVSKKKKNQKGGKAVMEARPLGIPGSIYPPPFTVNKPVMVKRRFISSATVALTWTLALGHQQFLVATTAILANPIVDVWRVHKIEMWAPPSSATAAGIVSLEPIAAATTDNFMNDLAVILQDQTSSEDRMAHICFLTDRLTPTGSWHNTSTVNSAGQLFVTTCTTGAVIDITFEVVYNYTLLPNGYTVAVAGATAGTLYSKSVSANLTSQGVNVI